jgi:enoyl-CoA hydratase/carnithine racemase
MSVVVEHLGHVTQLTLDRQDAANAINVEMELCIAEAIDAFAADRNARVLVVTGAGERSFCVGDPPPRRRARAPSGATTRHRSPRRRVRPRAGDDGHARPDQ